MGAFRPAAVKSSGAQEEGCQTKHRPTKEGKAGQQSIVPATRYADLRFPHSTTRLVARNEPMTTSTRWPRLTASVGFEKAIQYVMPVLGVLCWRSFPTFSISGIESLTLACASYSSGSSSLLLRAAALLGSNTR